MRTITSTAFALVALAAPAFAQDATMIQVAESGQYGKYLATGENRPVYLFTTDTQGTGDQEAQISCTSEECLNAWPLVTTQGDPQAGEEVDADMLGTTQYEGQTVVTYNGWPLYYFARDEGADAPQGQDIESFGGEWYLVTSEGEEVHAE
jgi:predicted lipoprotein with Yx(FWY)xxD motif